MKWLIIVGLILVNAVLLCAAGTIFGRQMSAMEAKKKEAEIAEQNARNGLR